MAHNEKMLNENPGWEGKAKILAISLDDDVEAPKKRIADREWNKVGSVWGGEGGFGCKPSQDYVVQGIPTCLLAHKGKILWRGHPSERKLDEDINGLIEGREVSFGGAADDSAESNSSQAMPAEEVTEKLNQVKEILASFREENDTCQPLQLYCIQEWTYRPDKPENAQTNCYLVGYNLSNFKPLCEAVAEKIRSIFPSVIERIQYRDPNPEIFRVTECKVCNKVLTEIDTMFIDLYTGDGHCEECENKTLEGTGSATMANFHHCYKVTAKSKNLNLMPWGPNEFPMNEAKEEPLSERRFNCYCDGRNSGKCPSNGQVLGTRWKCAHCPDFDFCFACETNWSSENPFEELISAMNKQGHFDWHVVIRMT